MLRYVDANEATVWGETDSPCAVNAHIARAFCVLSHHYAIVWLTDLEAGQTYTRTLCDSAAVWSRHEMDCAGLFRA